ncbi:hypothetical protein J7T55_009714 [Diaporthe amygdali]|uniref:uncharacterized protein n=1 Tax=Phomopsis amygdali TaxID=1214568 RepID=UPI0022FE7983|nr:uncharacterized protein J7T55_009714 [Diaporthe amygdali]KAJ0104049.1 hypothetical protein J7T55_009714 [Diaporthe amygdali]
MRRHFSVMIARTTWATACGTDINFYKATSSRAGRPFAVVEFKRRTFIRRAEMDAALRKYEPTAAAAAADVATYLTETGITLAEMILV